MGTAIQPKINIDGAATKRCQPKGAFYVDVPPGEHTVTASTETTAQVVVDTRSTDVVYVRCGVSFGLAVGRPTLEQVPPETGHSESSNLSLITATPS